MGFEERERERDLRNKRERYVSLRNAFSGCVMLKDALFETAFVSFAAQFCLLLFSVYLF